MSEMIERVARAICAGNLKRFVWDDLTDLERGVYRVQARASIEAIREPTPEMVINTNNEWVTGDEAASLWRAMAEQALK